MTGSSRPARVSSLRIAPQVGLIDITHLVQPGDVRRGAAVLAQTVGYLPPAVHVGVVDPGVGTSRRAVAVQAGHSVLVGPDNGLLSWAVSALGGASRVVQLTNGDLWLHPVSATFHGRDIFMPVAAHLAAGTDLAAVGDEIDVGRPGLAARAHQPGARRRGRGRGDVGGPVRQRAAVHPGGDVGLLGIGVGTPLVVRAGRRQLTIPFTDTFAAVAPGEIVAFTDSAGLISLAVNAGDAAQELGLPPGAHVRLALARQS